MVLNERSNDSGTSRMYYGAYFHREMRHRFFMMRNVFEMFGLFLLFLTVWIGVGRGEEIEWGKFVRDTVIMPITPGS